MTANAVHTMALAAAVLLGSPLGSPLETSLGASLAQAQGAATTPAVAPAEQLTPAQLDQLLAPIALYPDALLAQILMAATYPLEVVQADRWLQDPGHAARKGDELLAVLEQQPWDPSVKSLIPFARILRMMDAKLDWTKRLGDAFVADEQAVMDSVQRLRRRAVAAGKLRSTPRQVVTVDGEVITIDPADAEIVYVPVYDASTAYGEWPEPEFPPYSLLGVFDGIPVDEFGLGWLGAPIIAPLWGWEHCDWRRHRIDIDRDRFAALNHHQPPIGGGSWEHNPLHRHGVAYPNPTTRERFPDAAKSTDVRRSLRGYPSGIAEPVQGGVRQPQVLQRRVTPPTIESYGRGADVRMQAERGRASRMSIPATPSLVAPPRAAAPSISRGHR
jgi:hypothetical protein